MKHQNELNEQFRKKKSPPLTTHTYTHTHEQTHRNKLLYLLSLSLAVAALPPVTQTIRTCSMLPGLNVLFSPSLASCLFLQLLILLSRLRRWAWIVWHVHQVQPFVLLTSLWSLLGTLAFLNNFLQNEESVFCLSSLFHNALHHFLLVAHSPEDKEWKEKKAQLQKVWS